MPAYLISGPSGAGKSEVGKLLADKGLTVIETDAEHELSGYYSRRTGLKVRDRPPYPLNSEWHQDHAWNWDKDVFRELIFKNRGNDVFFCGGAHNEKDFFGWFAVRFALVADNDTLRTRLQDREPERWQDGSSELENILEWNKKAATYYRDIGSIVLDSARPVDIVAGEVLVIIDEHKLTSNFQ